MPRRLTLEEFIAKAREKHGNKYEYKHVVYENIKTPVKILCPIHGEFFRYPSIQFRSLTKNPSIYKNEIYK